MLLALAVLYPPWFVGKGCGLGLDGSFHAFLTLLTVVIIILSTNVLIPSSQWSWDVCILRSLETRSGLRVSGTREPSSFTCQRVIKVASQAAWWSTHSLVFDFTRGIQNCFFSHLFPNKDLCRRSSVWHPPVGRVACCVGWRSRTPPAAIYHGVVVIITAVLCNFIGVPCPFI